MTHTKASENEAKILAHYLVHEQATDAHIALYEHSVRPHEISSANKTLGVALRHPWLLPYLDAHDALFRPNSTLRQHLYLMFSILEASPDFVEKFLPKKRSPLYILPIVGYGIRGVYRAMIGTLLVRIRGL
jgi:hypothetical protein